MPRAASTTLTWMIASLPGIRMSGENNDAIKKIRTMLDSIVEKPILDGMGQRNSWGRHRIPDGSLSCVAQSMMAAINPPPPRVSSILDDPENEKQEKQDILGFKTVRLHQGLTMEDVPTIVKFLQESFPCARYIINYRSDQASQAESLKVSFGWKNDPDKIVEKLNKESDLLKQIAKQLGPQQATVLDSSEWTRDIAPLNRVVQWLGFASCSFDRLLEFNTGRKQHDSAVNAPGPEARKAAYQNGLTHLDTQKSCRYRG